MTDNSRYFSEDIHSALRPYTIDITIGKGKKLSAFLLKFLFHIQKENIQLHLLVPLSETCGTQRNDS